MKIKFTICMLILTNIIYGQRDSIRNNKFCIEITPTALLDAIDGPSYQIGSEIKLHNNLSVYFEAGGYFPINNRLFNYDGRMTNANGYIVKCELKYYLNRNHLSSGYYLSVEGFYKKQSFNWQDSIHLRPPYLTTFREFKSIYCFNVKYGQLIVRKSRILVDWYIGIGLRFKNVTSTLTPVQVSGLQYPDGGNYDNDQIGDVVGITPSEGTIVPNVELGVKIGYQIR